MAGQIQSNDAVVFLEEGHLLAPRSFITGPAMNKDDRFRTAAAHGGMDGDAVHGGSRRQHGKGQRKDWNCSAHGSDYSAKMSG